MNNKIETVDAYIASFPPFTQERLHLIRKIIREHAPGAVENIAYGMPAYKLNKKPLLYFAGYDKHVGFYALPSGHEKFRERLAGYKQGKGSVQFPHDQEFPQQLIADIVQFRVLENAIRK